MEWEPFGLANYSCNTLIGQYTIYNWYKYIFTCTANINCRPTVELDEVFSLEDTKDLCFMHYFNTLEQEYNSHLVSDE